MAPLDSLPADQRAVVQLVLQQGRSYDDIAGLLSIDRAGVRQRALDAFDALGPSNSIPGPQRALLTDYLLGQLPGRVADQVRETIAGSPPERAWLRVIASEVGSLATRSLPEIPAAGGRRAPAPAPAAPPAPAATTPVAARPEAAERPADPTPAPAAAVGATSGRGADGAGEPASRRGGAIVLGLAGLIIAAVVVVVLLLTGSGGTKHHSLASRASGTQSASGTPTGSSTPTTSTTSTNAKLVTQVNLNPPSGAKNPKGVAQVVSQGKTLGVLIIAQKVPPNSKKNAYAVWLYNSNSDSKLVGFVNTRVGSNGRLETEGTLPSNAAHYKHMLVTLETHGSPSAPGPVILEGALNIS